MEDLVRERMHAALDVEPTPAYLRSRIMGSLPVVDRSRPSPAPRLDWARTWVAALLVVAIVAGFAYVARQIGNQTVHHSPRPITPAKLGSPEGAVIGPDGLLYFSDPVSGYVFRLQPDGSLITVAGTRPAVPISQADAGNGGPATQAYLFWPQQLAFDSAGNLYVADEYSNRIRKIDRHGVISTLAGTGLAGGDSVGTFSGDGGPATAAGMAGPIGVAVDRSGDVYVGDYFNGKVRKVAGGRISSVDETRLPLAPTLFRPGYLAFDAAGDLYVVSGYTWFQPADVGCEIVRRSPDGTWTRVVGTGVCGFSGDGGPAIDATMAGGGGIAFDSAGNLYVADAANQRVRRVDRNGIITTVLEDNESPVGVAVSKSGVLYVTETPDMSLTPAGPGRIRAFSLANSFYIVQVVDSHTPIHTSG